MHLKIHPSNVLSGIIVHAENHMKVVSTHAMRDHWKVDIYLQSFLISSLDRSNRL